MAGWRKPWLLGLVVFLGLLTPGQVLAEPNNPATDWFQEARYGIFMHFLPNNPKTLALVERFDAEALARQLEEAGARYFVLTLGQNSGYFNAPNATYDKIAGYATGERCSRLDLAKVLQPRGIRLMLYLPCQTPNQDRKAQKAFGLPEGLKDQPIDVAFARKWAEVIREWADRYGDKVAGWWFDGGYEHVRFNEAIAQIYAEVAKHGNPRALVTFNPGVKVIHYTKAEDYTAGELNEPFGIVPSSRWLAGSQWHALTFLGSSWSHRNTRYPTDRWTRWVKEVTAHEGVVTLDMGPDSESASWTDRGLGRGATQSGEGHQGGPGTGFVNRHAPASQASDSFLGIHYDFHAGPDCKEIGKNTTRAMVESIINQVHPDYIQIDCKGHPGFSSYPTKVGNPAPGFVGDPLRIWRQVTAEHGVGLYMHYSGVWDSQAIHRNPDWAVINADGKPNTNATSFFGPYVDQLLIPQLRELAGVYGVDGAWMDGECWASMPDYSEAALKAFRQATGIQDVPRKPGDPHWYEFLQFHREAFRTYLRHYITEVKKTYPDLQLCSNWAFSDHMPEVVSASVDWISGDYSPEDSVNSARFSARYLARQGKPWDLMAWSFTRRRGRGQSNQKTAIQLQREAAVVLSLGGGFAAYFGQNRDGSVRLERVPVMAEVARFCRERQAICHHALPVPQVALLYSTAAHYREVNGLFPRDLSRLRGTLQALLESRQSVEVLSEHHLTGRMSEYPLIVVPECSYLEPAFRRELIAYVEGGGHLLLVGSESAALFQAELGATLVGKPQNETRYLEHAGALVTTKGAIQNVQLQASAQPWGKLFAAKNTSSPSQPAASMTSLGRGKMAATYFGFSQGYLSQRSEVSRRFLNDLARQLFPRPLVEVKGSTDVDVAVNRLGGRLTVNLVNTAGPHADVNTPILDAIPPVGPLEITIRLPKKPERITLEPGGQVMLFEHRAGETHVRLDRLDIHKVIVVE